MWRSFSLAIGITCILIGLECFAVEQFVITFKVLGKSAPKAEISSTLEEIATPPANSSKPIIYNTTEETPWICLAVGALIISYTILLPQRFNN